jgi:hypothetical protein
MEAEMAMGGDTDVTQPGLVDLAQEFLRGPHMIRCGRYHIKLSQAACDQYRDRNRDACSRCPNRYPIRARGLWTRQRILQTLEEYSRSKGRAINFQELTDEFGLSPVTVRREWGSWKALRAAARRKHPLPDPWNHERVASL